MDPAGRIRMRRARCSTGGSWQAAAGIWRARAHDRRPRLNRTSWHHTASLSFSAAAGCGLCGLNGGRILVLRLAHRIGGTRLQPAAVWAPRGRPLPWPGVRPRWSCSQLWQPRRAAHASPPGLRRVADALQARRGRSCPAPISPARLYDSSCRNYRAVLPRNCLDERRPAAPACAAAAANSGALPHAGTACRSGQALPPPPPPKPPAYSARTPTRMRLAGFRAACLAAPFHARTSLARANVHAVVFMPLFAGRCGWRSAPCRFL